MLERLFGTTAQPSLVTSAFEEFSGMLRQAAKMYDLAIGNLLDGEPLQVDLDRLDDVIDEAEASIRRAVLEHLSVSPKRDLVASLVLISMVQDAERIGDFARSLGDVPQLAKHPLEGPFADDLRRFHDKVRPQFDRCEKAFVEDNASHAQAVVDAHTATKPELSEYIARVAGSELSADMAIVYASSARILQRIGAHLSNISSSVVQPFDRIRHEDDDD